MAGHRTFVLWGVVCLVSTGCATVSPHGATESPTAESVQPSSLPREHTQPESRGPKAAIPVVSKVLMLASENYVSKDRIDWARGFYSALDAVADVAPEVLFRTAPDEAPGFVTAVVGAHSARFNVGAVERPWSVRSSLQQILGFIRPNLVPAAETARRWPEIEMAAANGFLRTLDPHSVLLDVDTYAAMRVPEDEAARAAVGLSLTREEQGDVYVTKATTDGAAAKAGIAARDRLVTVDGIPTATMTLDDVVRRLRGSEGSRVDLTVESSGARPRTVTLTRSLPSFANFWETARVLTTSDRSAKIGYLQLDHFAPGVTTKVKADLATFAAEKVAGIVVDLRGNSGGLYSEGVGVADAFIKDGTTVSMVAGAARKDEVARDSMDEPVVPLVVLVDQESSSATEFVAAALRDLAHAIVIGERTPGNTTVQVLFDIALPVEGAELDAPPQKVGLKLTSAAWLTSSGRAIEGVGVIPDVTVVPTRAWRDRSGNPRMATRATAHAAPPPEWRKAEAIDPLEAPESIPYFVSGAPPACCESRPPAGAPDFAVSLARDLLASVRGASQRDARARAKPFIAEARKEGFAAVSTGLGALGIDFRPGPQGPHGSVEVTLEQRGDGPVSAGEALKLRATVTNRGSTPLGRARLRVVGSSTGAELAELPIGWMPAGGVRSVDLEVPLAATSFDSTDVLRATFVADGGVTANPAEAVVTIQGRRPAHFDVSYRTEVLNDGASRTLGVNRRLAVTVTNSAAVASRETFAIVQPSVGAREVRMLSGRAQVPALAPGAQATIGFTYALKDQATGSDGYDLHLWLNPSAQEDETTDRIHLREDREGGTSGTLTPPALTAAGPTLVNGPSVTIAGTAEDPDGVSEVSILVVGARPNLAKTMAKKVFVLAPAAPAARLDYTDAVPVGVGANLVEVVARDTRGAETLRMVSVVRRK